MRGDDEQKLGVLRKDETLLHQVVRSKYSFCTSSTGPLSHALSRDCEILWSIKSSKTKHEAVFIKGIECLYRASLAVKENFERACKPSSSGL